MTALSAQVKNLNTNTIYMLQVESYTQVFDRTPMQAPLPGNNTSTTDPILIDLGFFTVQHTLNLTLNFAASTDGGNAIATKVQLEDAVKNWYQNGPAIAGNIELTINSGNENTALAGNKYVGYFRSCRFDLSAANQYYRAVLVFLSGARTN